MKRFIDVYEDVKLPGDSVGVRADGAVTAIFGDGLDKWERNAAICVWHAPDSYAASSLRTLRGNHLGRVEYDDGMPEPACEPSP